MTVMASGGGGGSSSGVTGAVPVTLPAPYVKYVKYAAVADDQSDLGGASLRNPASGAPDIATLSGVLTHSNGAIQLTDGTYQFTDEDGPDSKTLAYKDANEATITQFALLDTSAYDYLVAGRQTYTDATHQTFNNVLIAGVVTAAKDMPKSGQATYTGTATASGFDGANSYALTDGTSNIVAIFAGSGNVNATLGGFTPSGAPVDTIELQNMQVAGNTYSGTKVVTKLNGQTVDVTGAGSSAAQGTFFGYTASGEPAETGGVFTSSGSSGYISGAFLGN
jgi:hypothetical protein